MAWSFPIMCAEPASDAVAIYDFKQAMVAAGWDVAASGDGSGGLFNGSGDVFAASSQMGLANAWFRLRAPVAMSPRREFLFQRPNTTAGIWRIWYSSDGTGFTGGAPNATTRPTAADEQGLINTPSSTSQWISGTNTSYRMCLMIGGAAENYSFLLAFYAKAAISGFSSMLYLDVLSGDTNVLDVDQAVVGTMLVGDSTAFAQQGNVILSASSPSQTTGCSRGWYKKGLGGAAFVCYTPVGWGITGNTGDSSESISDYTGTNPDNEFEEQEIMYWRGGTVFLTERGRKGTSSIFGQINSDLNGFRLKDDLSRVAMASLTLPWDGVTEPSF